MTPVLSLLGRGLLAGGVSGVLAGGFARLIAEPVMDKAVDIESARSAAAGEVGVEVFTRGEQHFGLMVALLAVGLALGALFGLVYYVVHRSDLGSDAWGRSLRLATAGLVGVWLLPFLRYPANPPGVGSGDTVDGRTDAWLAATVMGLVAVAGALLLHSWLVSRGASAPLRHVVVTAVPVVALVLMFVILPNNTDPVEVPPTLLWDFRVLSAGTMVILWIAMGAVLGLLGLLGLRTSAARGAVPEAVAAS
ncbi:membrane protein [Longispora fulva]|uniref:Putative integral membrane protein n=1 Tax=Longispora fulva TaxID=619741 RepID=A0A8J7GGZ0_9ACTN|nr:CbtA family protein [Longispora fulva]MBG6137771.1 putative integral membrane protein [Longispora fulva]GIG62071.1 membrane protein [Longispora fulva]